MASGDRVAHSECEGQQGSIPAWRTISAGTSADVPVLFVPEVLIIEAVYYVIVPL